MWTGGGDGSACGTLGVLVGRPGQDCRVLRESFRLEYPELAQHGYRLVETGGEAGINGGIMKPKAGPWPGKLAFYIDVDDIDEFNQRIRNAGGRILVEKTNVPGVGELSLFEDPDGRVLGLWKQQF